MATESKSVSMTPMEPSTALKAEVARDCASVGRCRRRRLGLVAVVGLGIALGFGLGGDLRAPGVGTLSHSLVLAAYGLGGLILWALAFGITLPAGRKLNPAVALGVGLAFGLLVLTIRREGPSPPFFMGVGCLGTGVLVASVALAAALVLGRNVVRRHAPTGLLLGVGAGLLGLIPLHLTCPSCAPDHLLTWHAAVPVASGALAGLAWALLRPEP